MRIGKRVLAVLLVCMISIVCISGISAASKIKLNYKSLNITVGETAVLKVKGKKIKKKTFKSTNKKVATVSKKGVVTAKAAGTCKIKVTVKLKNKKKKKLTCKVTVVKNVVPVATKKPNTPKPTQPVTTKPSGETETYASEHPTFKLPPIVID